MHVHEALEQLDAIHEHLTKAEVYRGFKVRGVALVGVLGFLAAVLQQRIAASDPDRFVIYWLVIAGIGASLGFAAAAHAYFFTEDEYARRKTRRVLAQFLPCVAAGVFITAALARSAELIPMLPGLWAIVFGLGIVSARPYLPRGIGLVGLAYLLAGGVLFTQLKLEGWTVGGVFGAGHLLTAFVLWIDRPRDSNG